MNPRQPKKIGIKQLIVNSRYKSMFSKILINRKKIKRIRCFLTALNIYHKWSRYILYATWIEYKIENVACFHL